MSESEERSKCFLYRAVFAAAALLAAILLYFFIVMFVLPYYYHVQPGLQSAPAPKPKMETPPAVIPPIQVDIIPRKKPRPVPPAGPKPGIGEDKETP